VGTHLVTYKTLSHNPWLIWLML